MNDIVTISFWGEYDLIFRVKSTFYPNYHIDDVIYLNNEGFKVVQMFHIVQQVAEIAILCLDVHLEKVKEDDDY